MLIFVKDERLRRRHPQEKEEFQKRKENEDPAEPEQPSLGDPGACGLKQESRQLGLARACVRDSLEDGEWEFAGLCPRIDELGHGSLSRVRAPRKKRASGDRLSSGPGAAEKESVRRLQKGGTTR